MTEISAIGRGEGSGSYSDWRVPAHVQWARLEIAAMSLLILSYTWVWQRTFKGAFLVCVLAYLLIGISSHRRRGETAREIGFRLDNLRTAFPLIIIAIGPLAVITLLVGAWLQTYTFPVVWELPLALAAGSAWGLLQQYGLLAFFYRRLLETLPGFWAPTLAASSFFALFHLPNPFLMLVTLVAGVLACRVYQRAPNLLAIGIAHGVLSMVLHRSIPKDITMGMKVGPGFFRLLERLQDSGVETLF